MASNLAGKTVGVPRGLLRFLVLKMISEKPMSGVEIAQQIEKQTGGRWKPSPGSLYPLLAWMLDRGFTKETSKRAEGFKRYMFTVKGTDFLKKQIELGQDFLCKMDFLFPMLIEGLQLGTNKQKLGGVIEPVRQIISALIIIRNNLDELPKKDADEIAKALNTCSQKLGEIVRRQMDEEK
jgi:DNA-binding PadR family transcriptional regulator